MLHALDIFFGNRAVEPDDFCRECSADDEVELTCAFDSLPDTVELEEGIPATLAEERLLDQEGHLVVKRVFSRRNLRRGSYAARLVIQDFIDETFQNLCSRVERDLNRVGDELNLGFSRAGRGITNKGKREKVRQLATQQSVPVATTEVEPSGDLNRKIDSLLPTYSLFAADWRLSEEETPFQRAFRDLVAEAISGEKAKEDIEGFVKRHIDSEVEKIHQFLLQHTDEISALQALPEFKWKDLVSFRIEATDRDGVSVPLGKRGAGLRRLLMVAYFQYLAQRSATGDGPLNHIYGIEEPETFLHPGAQRELLRSLSALSSQNQMLVTSHSPVFAGTTSREGLGFFRKDGGVVGVVQGEALDLSELATDLGVEPADLVYGYCACVFVEGQDDVRFLKTICYKLRDAGHLSATLDDKRIGLIPIGGVETLKWWVSRRALKEINKHFGVLVDSDRKSQGHTLRGRLIQWKEQCEADGGKFHVTRKREIENYLHRNAIQRAGGMSDDFDDFTDMKAKFGPNIISAVEQMTPEEILERDAYTDNDGQERHELLEILQDFAAMAS